MSTIFRYLWNTAWVRDMHAHGMVTYEVSAHRMDPIRRGGAVTRGTGASLCITAET